MLEDVKGEMPCIGRSHVMGQGKKLNERALRTMYCLCHQP